jgi:long-chain acyl-CoA synthetase
MLQYFSKAVEQHAATRPDHTAYIFMGQETSYKNLNDDINRVAHSFLDLGVRPGDRIATILPQSPAFLTVFMACASMGLVLVPLDPRFTAAEMISLCKRTTPKLLVTLAFPDNIKQAAENLIKEVPFDHVFSYFGNFENIANKPYETLLESSPTPVPDNMHPQPDDTLVIIFTSGTTGKPKGALISHRNTYAISKVTMEATRSTPDDRVFFNLPTSHVGGTHDQITANLLGGGTAVICPTFNPQEILEFIAKYHITIFGGVPTMYRLIFRQCNVKDYDVSSVRFAVVSGEPSTPELIYQIKDNFPNATVAASWGMTETAGFFTFTKFDDDVKVVAETEGTPWDGLEMKVLRPDNTWANTGERGELCVKGDSVISRYMDEKDNEGAFFEGWLKTGDLGFMDERNYMHYAGRSKEMYISGGYNVYPLEVESFLNAHPKINTSAIIEVPDPLWGERGIAFIVPEEGMQIDEAEVLAYCKEGLADYKRPRKIVIEKDLPRTRVGKVDKQSIRREIKRYID